ncbi:MAG: 5-formyltetrahydrofolate cyclo-ligase [Omnitrophica bacterium RIFOXYB12_FULL_50_7]|nr:MAG: 5-formyltetrahydrofolate cyclo-ligase [Omnitrophica bacterium RIFOXYB12_FULL_50_7]
MSDKSCLRKALLEKRKKIPLFSRHVKSCRILRKLSREPLFRKAEHVAFYYGIAPEVETKSFLKKILKDKKIYLPRIDPKKSLALCRVRSLLRDLKKNAYNIMEPKALCEKRPVSKMDIILVPGVAFDKRGGRLGRGGGYYDRLLQKARKVIKIGLCFREQIVKKVPMKAHDVRVDRVITD